MGKKWRPPCSELPGRGRGPAEVTSFSLFTATDASHQDNPELHPALAARRLRYFRSVTRFACVTVTRAIMSPWQVTESKEQSVEPRALRAGGAPRMNGCHPRRAFVGCIWVFLQTRGYDILLKVPGTEKQHSNKFNDFNKTET